MDEFKIIISTLLFVYITINVVGFIAWFNTGFQLDELPIDLICTETDMNIFGKILCSVLVFVLLPLMHTIIFGYRFMHWITHVKKEK